MRTRIVLTFFSIFVLVLLNAGCQKKVSPLEANSESSDNSALSKNINKADNPSLVNGVLGAPSPKHLLEPASPTIFPNGITSITFKWEDSPENFQVNEYYYELQGYALYINGAKQTLGLHQGSVTLNTSWTSNKNYFWTVSAIYRLWKPYPNDNPTFERPYEEKFIFDIGVPTPSLMAMPNDMFWPNPAMAVDQFSVCAPYSCYYYWSWDPAGPWHAFPEWIGYNFPFIDFSQELSNRPQEGAWLYYKVKIGRSGSESQFSNVISFWVMP